MKLQKPSSTRLSKEIQCPNIKHGPVNRACFAPHFKLGCMQKIAIATGIGLGTLTASLLSSALGFAFGASSSGSDLNQFVIPFLSMIGSWVSGIGALAAAVVALKIAEGQTKHEHQQDAIRCIHHSLAIINDLRGRVCAMRLMLGEGKRPLLALTRNAETIERRYEMLYDREIYRHVPGKVIDAITGMSGHFFGLSVLVEGIASSIGIQPFEPLPTPHDDSRQPLISTLMKLESELDDLFSQFVKVREAHTG